MHGEMVDFKMTKVDSEAENGLPRYCEPSFLVVGQEINSIWSLHYMSVKNVSPRSRNELLTRKLSSAILMEIRKWWLNEIISKVFTYPSYSLLQLTTDCRQFSRVTDSFTFLDMLGFLLHANKLNITEINQLLYAQL